MDSKSRRLRDEYERQMGAAALERQDKAAEELGRCTCPVLTKNGSAVTHFPDCPTVVKALRNGRR